MKLLHYTHPFHRLPALAAVHGGRSPWSGLDGEIDRLLGSAFGGLSAFTRFPVAVHEDDDNVYVRAELPGVKREDIGVEVAGGNLTITANAPGSGSGDGGEGPATYTRTVSLSEAVQAEKISAAYENGVLTITLPKAEVAKPRKITVN